MEPQRRGDPEHNTPVLRGFADAQVISIQAGTGVGYCFKYFVVWVERLASRTEGLNAITRSVIGAAIEVHRWLGPGLLESVYLEALCCELSGRSLAFERQVEIPVRYKSQLLKSVYPIDLIVAAQIPVELKAVERLLPVHEAQLLTYLKLLNSPLGLIINFNVPTLVKGVKRLANRL